MTKKEKVSVLIETSKSLLRRYGHKHNYRAALIESLEALVERAEKIAGAA